MTDTAAKSWSVWEIKATRSTHVIPDNDLRPHDVSRTCEGIPTCWCKPYIDDGIIVHNSMDGREKFERGERKMS